MTTIRDDMVRLEFLPLAQVPAERRKAWGDRPTINWAVTLHTPSGAEVWRGIYAQGIGHHPNWQQRWTMRGGMSLRDAEWRDNCLRSCETGRYARSVGPLVASTLALPPPSARDVLHSLALDAGALDYASFEDWASEYGYDPDSRSAERTYRECLAIAVALRSLVGDDGIRALAVDPSEDDQP